MTSSPYEPHVSSAGSDPRWDDFVARSPGGHHLQSTYWARVKAALGWQAARVTALRDGDVCGGAQILLRRVPLLGTIGYVALGPVLDHDDVALRQCVLQGLQRISRERRTCYLVVQPPSAYQETVLPELLNRGFREAGTLVEPNPTATVVVDLALDEATLLAAMRKATRYNVRRAERIGVRVREGGERDVPTFHRLLTMTARRQGFSVPPEQYFSHLLRVMGPDGHAKIFVAEYGGRPLSAVLVIAFGNRVSLKRAAWSGDQRDVHPNELLQWTVIRWAKRSGYHYYDFEGIDRSCAAPSGKDGRSRDSVTAFKMGFGGDVVVSPAAYQRIANPLLRRAHDPAVRYVLNSPAGRWLVETVRTR